MKIEFSNSNDMNNILYISFINTTANHNKENFNAKILKEEFSLRNIDAKLEGNTFNWKEYIKKKNININSNEVENDGDEKEEKSENVVDRIYLPVNKCGDYEGHGLVYYRPCISGEIV
jgi:hypothetical protein